MALEKRWSRKMGVEEEKFTKQLLDGEQGLERISVIVSQGF